MYKRQVYNTFPLNDCPVDLWNAIDTDAIAAEHGAGLAVANGPRYWLMDSIEKQGASENPIETFGGLDMYLQATVDITEIGAGAPPYTVVRVDRSALFTFETGSTVFTLVDPDGGVYVMQSWSQQIDPTLDEVGLSGLGERLDLPSGWSYEVRVLDEPIVVDSTGSPATVIQDELKNTYSFTG